MKISGSSMGGGGGQGSEPFPATPALDRVREALGKDRNPEHADMIQAGRELLLLKNYYWNEELEQRADHLNLLKGIDDMLRFWDFWGEKIARALQEEEEELEEQAKAELRAKNEVKRAAALEADRNYRPIHKELMRDIISLLKLWIALRGALRP